MKNATTLFLVPMLALAVSGCGGGGDGGGTGGTGGGGAVTCSGTTIIANEANDYSFSSTITLPPVKVMPNTEITLDWTDATADIVRHPVDPKKDINSVSVLAWALSLSELETKFNADSTQSRDLNVVPISLDTDGINTTAKLFQFSLSGNPVSPADIMGFLDPTLYPPDSNTFTFMAAAGTVVGEGIHMIQSFQLDPASTNTTVKMTKDSTQLTFSADLTHLTPTGIPAGESAITLDWSQMTTNALGNEFITTKITRALLGHYIETPAELSTDKFLDLEIIATTLYRGDIPTGSTVDFSSLADENGNKFTGIDATGTWIFALQCGGCHNPAPWYLTVLKPCS